MSTKIKGTVIKDINSDFTNLTSPFLFFSFSFFISLFSYIPEEAEKKKEEKEKKNRRNRTDQFRGRPSVSQEHFEHLFPLPVSVSFK